MSLGAWATLALVAGVSVVSFAVLLRSPGIVARPDPTPRSDPPAVQLALHDVTHEAGITFVHTHGGAGKLYIMEAMTAGMATFDYDGDGMLDLYFVNGSPLVGTPSRDPPPRNALYRNLGNWQFVDVTDFAGVGNTGYGLGVAVADYDNDGDADLYINNYGPNVFYRNNGDGTFTDISDVLGIDQGDAVGAGVCFLDIDADGAVDLFSGNYIRFAYELHPCRYMGGFLRAPSPADFAPDSDKLYKNRGDGTWDDVSSASGISERVGRTMGLISADFDDDGDLDVFVCNDMMPNFLWQNDGTGRFREVAGELGVAHDCRGRNNASMGADCADYDNDGWLDLFMTNYQAETPCLYRNGPGGFFEEVAIPAGVATACLPHVNWGNCFLDVDNDGDRDLYVGNGHTEPMIRLIDRSTDYCVPNVLFLNLGQGKFRDVSREAGPGLTISKCTRGTCCEDLDNDGNIDLVMVNQEAEPTLLRNATEHAHHWLHVRLVGTNSNRDGIGARVCVVTGPLRQVAEVHSGRGYQSHHGTRLHFGLGAATSVDAVVVRWLGGTTDQLECVAADQIVTIVEGSTRGPPTSVARGDRVPCLFTQTDEQ